MPPKQYLVVDAGVVSGEIDMDGTPVQVPALHLRYADLQDPKADAVDAFFCIGAEDVAPLVESLLKTAASIPPLFEQIPDEETPTQ